MLLVGVIGGFIPVLQGWIFVIAGLTLMAPESERARRALEWAKKKVGAGNTDAATDDTHAANDGTAGTGEGKEES
ncbi:MAG: hypothetical protein ACI8TX_000254 [Hyphomicrobiaceae bacterium]